MGKGSGLIFEERVQVCAGDGVIIVVRVEDTAPSSPFISIGEIARKSHAKRQNLYSSTPALYIVLVCGNS